MLTPVTTNFLSRLRANDQAAWYELWETFGPVVQAQLNKWGRGRIGHETVRDLSQETLAALSESIDRFDPGRGVRFSTWLLSIARHVLGDELDKRGALKRGGDGSGGRGGQKAGSLDESWMVASKDPSADEQYEAAVFRAKVEAAIRAASKECEFSDFQVFQSRVLEGQSGKDVAAALGVSEPTISRRVARVRDVLRRRLAEVVSVYSFTQDEADELARNGLARNGPTLNPKQVDVGGGGCGGAEMDAAFDQALAEVYHRQAELRREQSR
ncbi:MAG TPA: sigma-70 family RNA polymerase sigma factor [Phycisphaerales bacterium]|nr:sigma-70 family RNA polymerase sigma factor [Phycisphaerales bacterium]